MLTSVLTTVCASTDSIDHQLLLQLDRFKRTWTLQFCERTQFFQWTRFSGNSNWNRL